MFSQDEVQYVRQLYREGRRPSEILRALVLVHEGAAVPDLMRLLQVAFSLAYDDVQCVGGWWHDGTGELSDAQLDAFLLRAIREKKD